MKKKKKDTKHISLMFSTFFCFHIIYFGSEVYYVLPSPNFGLHLFFF